MKVIYPNKSQKQILLFLYEHKDEWIYKKKIAVAVNLSLQATMNNLKKLEENQMVKFRVAGNSFKMTYYTTKWMEVYKSQIIDIEKKKDRHIIATPELALKDSYLPSHYIIDIYPINKEDFEKKAFIVDDKKQISTFIGSPVAVKYYRITTKVAYGTRSSGGMPNYLSVTVPENVYKKLKMLTNKQRYYDVHIGDRQFQSLFSYGQVMFIKGGTL